MKVSVGLPSKWMDALPVYTLHVMTITVLLIAPTLLIALTLIIELIHLVCFESVNAILGV